MSTAHLPFETKPFTSYRYLTISQMGKKKESSSLSTFYISHPNPQIHPDCTPISSGSPISPSRHYLARNITPHQPPTLRSPNAGNPILPPPARGYPRPTPQLPPNPRPPLGGARRWAGVGWGGLGWTRVGWGGARPSPTSPSPRRRHEGEGVPKPHLQLRPSPGARCPALARAGRKKQATKRQKSLGQRQAGSSRSRLTSDLPPPRPSHPLQGCCCC